MARRKRPSGPTRRHGRPPVARRPASGACGARIHLGGPGAGRGLVLAVLYYDNGQKTVAHALHRALDYALARNSVVYRAAAPSDYRLSQAADYVCTMELAAIRYEEGRPSPTDEKFFGSRRQFKKGILKELRAKRF